MARRKPRRRSSPSARGRTHPARVPWLTPELRGQIKGIAFGALGLAVLLSLVTLPGRGNLIGSLGDRIAGALTISVGRMVAFAMPALLLWWGWLALGDRRPQHSLVRYGGAALLVVSICALAALGTRHLDRSVCLSWSGFVGIALVYDTAAALNLPRYLGAAGTGLLFTATALMGLVLATDVLFTHMAQRIGLLIGGGWRKAWRGMALALRGMGELVLPSSESESDESEKPANRRPLPTPKPTRRVLNPGAPVPERLGPPPRRPEPIIVDHDQPGPPPPRPPRPERAKPPPRRREEPAAVQPEFDLGRPYELPPLRLLTDGRRNEHKMSHEEIRSISAVLEQTLADFGIEAQVEQVTQGPVITRFEIRPAPGVKVTRIASLHSDIALALRAKRVRIQAPIPGKAAIGIEVPNPKPNFVHFKDLAITEAYQSHRSPLAFILGKKLTGEPCILDLQKMPHLLIAGATGSGKSVCLNALIASILFRQPPDKVKLMLIDPKRVEFRLFDAIPHLISPVVTDSRKAPSALAWMVEHMEERYEQLAEVGVRNIDAHNHLVLSDKPEKKAMNREIKYMPHIVVVIDELADLMMVAKAEVEENVQRIAQMARAVGIHLVLATQRPSVKIITGVIKANLPARIAFQVSQRVDSRVIIDQMGADALLGNGDLLFSTGAADGPQRMQGAFIADDEVERLCEFILAQERAVYLKEDFKPKQSKGKGDADEPIGADFDLDAAGASEALFDDDLFRRAAILILENRKASVSLIQRRLKIGFARAGRLIDMMEQAGIVGPYQGSKPREILVDPVEYLNRLRGESAAV